MTRSDFLATLFDPDEATCFSNSPDGVSVFWEPLASDTFFSINPLSPIADMMPEKPWHAPDKPRRADHNVVCYRNILIELDNMPIMEQQQYVLERTPVTSIVFSGNKSYHFIISLANPCPTREAYDKLVRAFHRLLPLADKSTKNPSRFSRLPGVVRPDTGLLQELVYLGSRIQDVQLPTFPPAPQAYERPTQFTLVEAESRVREGLQLGPEGIMAKYGLVGRNQAFYWFHKRLQEYGAPKEKKKQFVDQFYAKLENKKGFPIKEAYLAARVKCD